MIDPQALPALLSDADAALKQGALPEADELYGRVLAIDPVHPDALRHHVVLAAKLGHPKQALAALDTAARAEPDNPAWPFGRALLLAEARQWEDAVAAYDRALTLRPDDFASRWGRAGALVALGRFEDALTDHDRGLALRPDAIECLMARAGVLALLRRYDAALAAYDRVIALREDFAEAWFAKALLLLSLGRYKEGWPLYEWRWFIPGTPGQGRLFAQPMWDGTPLGDRVLYIHIEQGLGDSVQFYRFVLQAKRLGKVVFGVSTQLARLFSSQPDAPMVVSTGQPMPRIDLHCPIMSLPWLLGTELATLPPTPYLRADAARSAAWHARLAALPGRKVGLVWAGAPNPGDPRAHAVDQKRSISLAHYAPLAAIEAVSLISLQKGEASAQARNPPPGMTLHDWTDELHDFADTAALVDALDLVISVDTAVVHLAGALGKPVWVLNRFDQCWRWLRDRDDSPWYRSARLFRQPMPRDWDSVIAAVVTALRRWAT